MAVAVPPPSKKKAAGKRSNDAGTKVTNKRKRTSAVGEQGGGTANGPVAAPTAAASLDAPTCIADMLDRELTLPLNPRHRNGAGVEQAYLLQSTDSFKFVAGCSKATHHDYKNIVRDAKELAADGRLKTKRCVMDYIVRRVRDDDNASDI